VRWNREVSALIEATVRFVQLLAAIRAYNRTSTTQSRSPTAMSEVILSCTMQEIGSSDIRIRLLYVSGNEDLYLLTVVKNEDVAFSGVYNPGTDTAKVYVNASDFAALKVVLAGGAEIPITLHYESTTGEVTRFCYASVWVPDQAA
jgi:hypothetical protein